jgi:RNA polymerase sigma factor (sigma-70 family)
MNVTSPAPLDEALNTFSETLTRIARAHHLRREDAEDFIQSAHLRLVEGDYDIFRRFAGRSSLRTYLVVVGTRLLLDWRNETYGKWRTSMAATRLGEPAILLERLLHRDGYELEAAIERVCARHPSMTAACVRELTTKLPSRCRPQRVSEQALHGLTAVEPDNPIAAAEQAGADRRIVSILSGAVQSLPEQERRLIRGKYEEGRSIQALAAWMAIEPRRLYRLHESVLRKLRRRLVATGVTGPVTFDTRHLTR